MAFDIVTARARVALAVGDTSQDAVLTGSLNVALAVIERYLNRNLTYSGQKEEHIKPHQSGFLVKRYPIDSVIKVTKDSGGGLITNFLVHNEAGIVEFDNSYWGRSITLEYTGGYKVLPADLEFALWLCFDAAHAASGAGGAVISAAGLESISIPDVGTIRLSAGGAVDGGAGSGGGVGLMNDLVIDLLEPFRRVIC